MPPRNHPSALDRVTEAFDSACATLAPLAPRARLLLACSAGGDSMSLLDLMTRAAPARQWALAVVHLDHRQREASAAEAQAVAEQVTLLGLPLFMERLGDERVQAAPLSEDAMRQARHACYRRFARVWNADAVVLAHQADDRAETLLLRLLAGSGPTGLGSIRPLERLGGLTLVRPLLAVRRADLREVLRAHGLEWREDPSNDEPATKRGWLRNVLMPLVRERLQYDPTGQLVRAAELIDEEAAVLDESTRLILNRLVRPAAPPAAALLDLADPLWREAGALLRRQLLRQWLWELRQGPHPPGYEAVAEALAFVQRARPGAELRTVERFHVTHLKAGLLAFAPEVPPEARARAAAPLLPAPAPKKRKT